jgi:predicted O-methyltransferase YrrM
MTMQTNNNFQIEISSESLQILKQIHQKMDVGFFHQHVHILYDLRTMLNKEFANYLEIGVFGGATSSLMLSHPQKTKVVGIEINPQDKFKNFIESNNIHNNEFYYIGGNSRSSDTINKIKELIPEVDILFIDGDHSYDAVIDDFSNYHNQVLPGGFIVFDDYWDSVSSAGVKPAVDFIVNNLLNDQYEIWGYLPDTVKSGDYISDQNLSNEFILKKIR